MLLCGGGVQSSQLEADFAFFLTRPDHLNEAERHFSLSAQELALLNPISKTCPTFRYKREAEINKHIYRLVPAWALHKRTPEWPGTPKTPFNMSNDSALFIDKKKLSEIQNVGLEFLPLYESKYIHQFNHRYATSTPGMDEGVQEVSPAQLKSPSSFVGSRYWLPKPILDERFPGEWFLVYRKIARATDERTSIAAVIPEAPCGDSLILIEGLKESTASALCGVLNSFIYDFCARQKVAGTNFNHWIWHQLPIPPASRLRRLCTWATSSHAGTDPFVSFDEWLLPRVLELTYTAWDLESFAQDCSWNGPPFRWDEERRFLLRCELDAAFFHLYLLAAKDGQWKPARVAEGAVRDETPEELAELKRHFPTPRDAVAYIMDTFPILRRKDEEKHGEYRTKRVILEIYDEMSEAMRTGKPYQTRINPPPGPPADEKGNFLPLPEWHPGQSKPPNWPPHVHPPKGYEGASKC